MSLSEAQLGHLERRLLDERARASDALNGTLTERSDGSGRSRAGDASSVPFHPADLGTDTMSAELDASNATRISRELAEIEAALERLYEQPDTFGRCEQTGREIPFERLDIIPWARTCDQGDAGRIAAGRDEAPAR